MNIIESFSAAIKSVMGNKMRSLLTMLGIIIGIAAVIMIMGVGQGVKTAVFSMVDSIDKRLVQVYLMNYESEEDSINFSDIEALKKIKGVSGVTGTTEWWGMELQLLREDEVLSGPVLGADENYGAIEKVEIQMGRFISENDNLNSSKVAVIHPYTAVQVFGYVNCIGEKVSVSSWGGTEEYTVIGVYAGSTVQTEMEKMVGGSTPLKRAMVTIPIRTFNDIYGNGDRVDFLGVSVDKDHTTAEVSNAITTLLNIRHNKVDGYRAESLEAMFAQMETALGAITGFIAFVAGISLFVGGVGVMNIMLVSVKERTREIGIRKALGATEGNIKLQFLLESVTLSLLGGAIGIFLGIGLAIVAGNIITGLMETDVIPSVSSGVIIMACGVSTFVGVVFGVYPAGKAAKLDPIESLRYE